MNNQNQAFPLYPELLKRGSCATVYVGQFNKTIFFAIKKFNESHLKTEECQREIVIQKKLKHPNIVTLLSSYLDSNQGFILLELMTGGSLLSLIENQKLTLPASISIIHDLLNGLAYLHGLTIVHRDIKSANILLDQNLKAKIADFELAIELSERTKLAPDKLFGTPKYIAPELTHNAQHCSEKSDIYAASIVFFEMASCHRPYETMPIELIIFLAEKRYETLNQHLLNAIPPSTPSWLHSIIELGTQKDPSVRPLTQDIFSLVPDSQTPIVSTTLANKTVDLNSYKSTYNTTPVVPLDEPTLAKNPDEVHTKLPTPGPGYNQHAFFAKLNDNKLQCTLSTASGDCSYLATGSNDEFLPTPPTGNKVVRTLKG
jgi:serine/threonine protein kinase